MRTLVDKRWPWLLEKLPPRGRYAEPISRHPNLDSVLALVPCKFLSVGFSFLFRLIRILADLRNTVAGRLDVNDETFLVGRPNEPPIREGWPAQLLATIALTIKVLSMSAELVDTPRTLLPLRHAAFVIGLALAFAAGCAIAPIHALSIIVIACV